MLARNATVWVFAFVYYIPVDVGVGIGVSVVGSGVVLVVVAGDSGSFPCDGGFGGYKLKHYHHNHKLE